MSKTGFCHDKPEWKKHSKEETLSDSQIKKGSSTVLNKKKSVFWDMKWSIAIDFFEKDVAVNNASYC